MPFSRTAVHTLMLTGLATLGLAARSAQAAVAYSYARIDPFGLDSMAVTCLNASGQVAGDYMDSASFNNPTFPEIGNTYGYLTGSGGVGVTQINPFKYKDGYTVVSSDAVNAAGQVAGTYAYDTNNNDEHDTYGFLTGPDGAGAGATRIDPFGSSNVSVAAVNAAGQVAGTFFDPSAANSYFGYSGFVTGANGAGATRIDPFGSTRVSVTGVSDSGRVVGTYQDPTTYAYYGFLTGPGGVGTAKIDPFGTDDVASAFVNATGQVAGEYINSVTDDYHSYLLGPDGMGATAIDPYGSTFVITTGLNAGGQLAGYYADPANPNNLYGFVTGPGGAGVTEIDPFGSPFAQVLGINDSGQIIGTYSDPATGNRYAFLGTPNAAVPEPGVLPLLALGLLPIGLIAHRRRAWAARP